jgi:hypothetical protein
MNESHNLDTELCDLWARRRDLDENGWSRLYSVVMFVLMSYKPRELAGLHEDRDIYIQEFFEDKVFRLDSLSRCDHVGALRLYYLNYLRDLIRSKQSRSKWEVADAHNPDDPDNDSAPSLNEAPDPETGRDPIFTELEEAGFSPTQVAASAATWLASHDEWVRIFVAFSNCPDAELSEPLVHLAKRKGIKSQAYKAEQLGFNWKKADLAGFADTLLGRWISESIGIELRPENSPLILGVLKILCFEALTWAEQQEAAT